MSEKTGISWTDYTFNPWMGCEKVSPGCSHCYAETLTKGRMGLSVWGKNPRQRISDAYMRKPLKWDRDVEKTGKDKVFCGSLMDWAEDNEGIKLQRVRLWAVIAATKNLKWQMLTKRPENIVEFSPTVIPDNVWLGVSIENADYAYRADILRQIPAKVRFISYEPALGPLDLRRFFGYRMKSEKEHNNEPRRICLSCGYQWRDGDRLVWKNLEGIGELRWQNDKGAAQTSRAQDSVGLSSGSENGGRQKDLRGGTQVGLLPSPRKHPERLDDQSPKWHQRRQQDRQFGIGNVLGESSTQNNAGTIQPERRAQPSGEVDRCTSCGNSETAWARGETFRDSNGFWHQLPARFQNSGGSAALIHWIIVGGESGTNFRPMNLDWARSMRKQCLGTDTAFFFKQSSAFRNETGIELDGEIIHEFPV